MNADRNAPEAATLFQRSGQLVSTGDYASALNCVAQALALDRSHAGCWDLLARLQLQFGAIAEAVQSASNAVHLAPRSPDCRYSLGRALKANGQAVEAVAQYRQALLLGSPRAHYLCSLGIALRSLGRVHDAIASYRAALALEPENHEAQYNLANALQEAGQASEANGYSAAQSRLGADLRQLTNEAAALHEKGEYRLAMLRWTEVLRLAPNSADAHHCYAATLNKLLLLTEALQHEERALALDPNHRDALDGAFKVAWVGGEVDKVARYGARLDSLAPSVSSRIIPKLALPVILDSREHIIETRRRYELGLDELLTAPSPIARPHETVRNVGFYLAYHGENNRLLQDKFARLMLACCPDLGWQAPHCRRYRRSGGRLRVGFASELFRDHSIGKTSSGLIAQLDRARFEVLVLNLPGSAPTSDSTQQWIRRRCDHWLTFNGGMEHTRAAIADLKLDALFYQDIGMTPFSFFLAFARLAPLQCVSYGHPDTTGIPNLDYFISNDLYEPPGASEHYTERLFLLHDLPTLAYYYRPETPASSATPADWGFAADEHLYVCAQTLFKLHPEFDQILGGILARDARARIVLIDGQYKGWSERLARRFRGSMGVLAERISFVQRMDGERYLGLLRLAHVALDTIHFNGMNSSLEALAMGTPVVTWPGKLQRGRHTQAMYRRMQLQDCIARDASDYVEIAVRIGTDPDYRRALSRSIVERSTVLFEDPRTVREFERFFDQALATLCA